MKKKIVFFGMVIFIIMINTNVNAKYLLEYTHTIANIQIDQIPPKVELISAINTQTANETYENQTNSLIVTIKIIEKNIQKNNFNQNYVEVLVGDKKLEPEKYEIIKVEQTSKIVLYNIKLHKIVGEENLKIKVKEGTIEDISNNKNQEQIFVIGIKSK